MFFIVFCSKMLISMDVTLFNNMLEVTGTFCTYFEWHITNYKFNFLTISRVTKCFYLAILHVNVVSIWYIPNGERLKNYFQVLFVLTNI